MRILPIIFLLIGLSACNPEAQSASVQPISTADVPTITQRDFRLGFSNFPYAATTEGVTGIYQAIAEHADIYVEQFDEATLPWDAALNGTAFPAKFQERLDRAVSNRVQGVPLVLVVMPLSMGRDGIAAPLSGTLPTRLQDKPLDDPAYVLAFSNYVERLAQQLGADYLVTGLEVNELYLNNPDVWPAYIRFNQEVTRTLRERLPGLPISQSITLHSFFSEAAGDADHRAAVVALLETQDFTAVSYYPFLHGAYDDTDAYVQAFDLLAGLTNKPIAFTESGNIAERLQVRSLGLDMPGTEQSQNGYIAALLERAQRDEYLFVINWAARDFDALTAILPRSAQALARIWQDTGLIDEAGRPRVALQTWQSYLRAPYR